MLEALAPLYGRRTQSVIVVSGYDGTIMYANEALGRRAGAVQGYDSQRSLPIDFVGRNMRELTDLYRLDHDATATAQALATGELQCLPGSGTALWCSSLLTLSDVHVTAFTTEHDAASEQLAIEEHQLLRKQATVAIEFAEAERLIQVGMEALHRARQRIASLNTMLLHEDSDISV